MPKQGNSKRADPPGTKVVAKKKKSTTAKDKKKVDYSKTNFFDAKDLKKSFAHYGQKKNHHAPPYHYRVSIAKVEEWYSKDTDLPADKKWMDDEVNNFKLMSKVQKKLIMDQIPGQANRPLKGKAAGNAKAPRKRKMEEPNSESHAKKQKTVSTQGWVGSIKEKTSGFFGSVVKGFGSFLKS